MDNIPKVYLRITEINEEYDAWDIISGDYTKPTGAAKKWEKANDFILLTILKN